MNYTIKRHKACSRCRGTLIYQREIDGTCDYCLNCGNRNWIKNECGPVLEHGYTFRLPDRFKKDTFDINQVAML